MTQELSIVLHLDETIQAWTAHEENPCEKQTRWVLVVLPPVEALGHSTHRLLQSLLYETQRQPSKVAAVSALRM
jgi:hypothetical protein